MKKVIVIGGGFSGISAATSLAHKGFDVTLLEKHSMLGGRSRKFSENGFTFDMGPSWYWMPDVFEKYFNRFGKSVSDYYNLIRLDPSYKIYFSKNDIIDIPASIEGISTVFEGIEKGAGMKLQKFLAESKVKYDTGISKFVYKPSESLIEFMQWDVVKHIFRLDLLTTFNNYTGKFFKDPRLKQILEFPVLFLGGTGKTTPALYSLMNYADMALGTWYPEGGMYKVVEAMQKLAEELGVKIILNENVEKIEIVQHKAVSVVTASKTYKADYVVSSADYHFTETKLLHNGYRNYPGEYWNTRTMSPSSLIFYLGINKKLNGLEHHTLFFDEDFGVHADEIYEIPSWPSKPSLYLSCTSKTDPAAAPDGYENLFLLIPVAPGLEDNEIIRERYLDLFIGRFEKLTGQNIKNNIVYKRSYAINDFIVDYNAFQGNAYGLANTLRQTAFLKPRLRNKKVSNLFYTGQLTVPGPGVPPALISGQIVSDLIGKEMVKYSKTDKL